MRRGMLMTVLQQYALEQPVWKGKTGERCVCVCVCVQRGEDVYVCVYIHNL